MSRRKIAIDTPIFDCKLLETLGPALGPLLKKQSIRMLEEATSHVDSESEALIEKARRRVIEARTKNCSRWLGYAINWVKCSFEGNTSK